MRALLKNLFLELDSRVTEENKKRCESGALTIGRSEITVLGQTSLLAQPDITMHLELAQTGDLDAKLRCDYFVKAELKKLLPQYHLIYDEDSELIFIPKGSQFYTLGEYQNLDVKVIDPESALVSKAVKAPEKNKQLLRSALTNGDFPKLADRIVAEGGNLELFT